MTAYRVLLASICLGMFTLLGSPRAIAVDAWESLSELDHRQWGVREGAPAGIAALAQTSDGYLWLAAESGLYRFDGIRFERPAFEAAGPIDGDVSAVFATTSGDLWIGMRFGGVYCLSRGKLTHYGNSDGLPTRSVIQLAQRQDGTIWLQSTAGLYRLEGSKWRRVDESWNFSATAGSAVFVDGAGDLWARGEQGTFLLRKGSHHFEKTEVPAGHGIIAAGPGTSVWAGDDETGLYSLTDPPARILPSRLGSADDSMAYFLVDRQGTLWGTKDAPDNEELVRIRNAAALMTHGTVVEIESLSGQSLTSPEGRCFLEDREGDIWVGTSAGLDRFRRNRLHQAYPATHLLEPGMAVSPSGDIWYASAKKFVRVSSDEEIPAIIDLDPRSPFMTAAAVLVDADGEMLIGTEGHVLLRYANRRLQTIALPKPESHAAVHGIAKDASGALWIAIAGDALYKQERGGAWEVNGGLPELPNEAPISVSADSQGRLWLGYLGDRIVVVDKSQVTLHTADMGLNVAVPLSVAFREGRVWVGGSEGSGLLLRNRFMPLLAADGFPRFSGISGVVEDALGGLWLNGRSNIAHVEPAEIQQFLSDPSHRVSLEVFSFEDGLKQFAPQLRPLHTALEGKDGRIWFLTTAGGFWIDPNHIPRNTVPPSVMVQSVINNGRPAEFAKETVSLPTHSTAFEIDYTATSLAMPSRVRFRYQLEGVDKGWQEAGNRRQAFYTNVPPGHHLFQVVAANEDGVWTQAAATTMISIPPAFYQTRWFDALCAAAAMVILWQIYRLRLVQVKLRLGERMAERERIARELHDTLIQSAQGLILIFQGFAGQLIKADPMRQRMEEALDQADHLLNQARDRVRDLRGMPVDGDLLQGVKRMGNELFAGGGTEFSAVTAGTPKRLSTLAADEVYKIAREALANARLHALAKQVEVDISFGDSDLTVRVRDDGKGIEPEVLQSGHRPGHFGMQGLRERASRLGATINVWSRLGAGTEIELVVPAAQAYVDEKRPSWLKRLANRLTPARPAGARRIATSDTKSGSRE